MTCDFIALANKGVREATPYQAGKSIESLMRELNLSCVIKLASNENPLGPSPKAIKAMQKTLTDMHYYPDTGNHRLKHALAEFNGVDPEQIIIANGSDALIRLLNYTFVTAQHEVIVSEHTFSPFVSMPSAIGAKVISTPAKNWGADLDAMLDAINERTKLICLANPNNPTGTWFNHRDFLNFMKKVPSHIIVLMDEAYYEFIDNPDYPQSLQIQKQFSNMVISRTFSKAYGLAGIRVGYFIADPQICALINRIRLPFAVATPANVAALAALEDQEHVKRTTANNRESLSLLENGLKTLGLSPVPSVANFSFVDLKQEALPIYQELLKKGFIIRPLLLNYGLKQHVRISAGTCEETEKFLKALETVY
jgi:histidinol-phosphate aminotransferase